MTLKLIKYELVFSTIILFLRLPSFFEPRWHGDEEIYLTIAQLLSHGSNLYQHVIDHKPPLIYWLTMVLGTPINLKIYLTISVILSAIILIHLIKLYTHRFIPVVIGMTIFILGTCLPSLEGNVYNAELLFMPFTLLGTLIFLKYIIINHLLSIKFSFFSGLSFGIAVLFKLPALLEIIAIIILFIILQINRICHSSYLKILFSLIAGLLTPFIIIVLYFVLTNSLAPFIYYAFIYNFKYLSDWSFVHSSTLAHFISPLWLRVAILLFIVLFTQITLKKTTNIWFKFVIIWTACSWFGALISLRPYPHYFIQTIPPLALTVVVLVTQTPLLIKGVCVLLIISQLIFIKLFPLVFFRTISYYQNFLLYFTHQINYSNYSEWFRQGIVKESEISQWLKSRYPPSTTLFIFGNHPSIYYQSQLTPSVKYLTDYHITSFNAVDDIINNLSSNPPQILANCQNTNQLTVIDQLIINKYSLIYNNSICHLYHLNIK